MTRKNNPTKTGTNWLYGLITSCLLILVFPVSLYFNLNFFVTRFAEGLAIDQQGNLYIAEEDLARVEKYTPNGDLLTTFGSEGQGNGQFSKSYGPHSVAVDRQGNVYALQNGYINTIEKFDAKGNFLLQWQPTSQAEKLVVDSQNNIYVLTTEAPFIHKYNSNGQKLLSFGTVGEEPGQLGEESYYKALALDSQNNIYVLDPGKQQIVKYDAQGHYLNHWDNIIGGGVLAIDQQHNFYLTDGYYTISKYNSQGQLLLSWGGQDDKDGKFNFRIRQIVVDQQGNLYTISPGNGPTIVQKFDNQGRFLKSWTAGFPYWVRFFLQALIPLLFVLPSSFLIRKALVFPKPTEEALVGVTLPYYVMAAAQKNDIYHDQLDLKKLRGQAHSIEWKQSGGLGCTVAFMVSLAIIGMLVASIFVLGSTGNEATIRNFLIIFGIVVVFLLIAGVTVIPKELKEFKEKRDRLETIWKQAHSTLSPANRSLFMIGSKSYNDLGLWLFIFLGPNLFFLFVGREAINLWFHGWPGYLIESLIAIEITAVVLLCLVVFNALTRPVAGVVKLNRTEMLSLAGYLVRYIGIFIALTIGLGVLESWINGTLAGPAEGHVIVVVTPLSMIFPLVKYGYLALGLVFVPLQWIFVPFNRCEYDEALRRINFLRRCANTITLRQIQIDILRRSGRLVEAEYLTQEGLSGQVARQQASLGALLETLALIKMYQGRYAESLYFMERSIELRPTTKVGLSNLAEIYLWVGAYPARALYLMNEARKDSDLWLSSWLLPYNVGDRYINRAWALARMGQYAEAQQLTQTALKKAGHKFKPGISSIHFRAAKIMELCHNETAAAEHYQQAYWLDPTGYYGKQVIPLLLTGDSTSSINRLWDF